MKEKERQEIIHWQANNVNTDHNYEDLNHMHFAPDWVQISGLVNIIVNLRIP
jgi:hypothetical protein